MRMIWLGAMALTILAGIAIPYGPLAGSQAVPLFWGAFGLAVIVLITLAVARWRV